MSLRLARAGHDLTVYDVNAEATEPPVAAGARAAGTAAAAAAAADVLITSLPTPAVVDDVMLGAGAALAVLPDGALWIDMSTSVPSVAERVRACGAARGIRVLDAPVAGMSKGAVAGTLQIYVGGAREDFESARPILEVLGDPERIIHVGGHGAGYTVKLMLNLLWFSSLVNITEALMVGVRAGVDLGVLHRALVASPSNSVLLERDLLPLLREGDYEKGFALSLACKDLGLAVDLARSTRVPAEASALVEQIVRRAQAQYGDDVGEMAAVRLYEDVMRTELRMSDDSSGSAGDGEPASGS
jgi:3-hydroxyisobutyrate dehydrogenase